jgi:hypothetical protein
MKDATSADAGASLTEVPDQGKHLPPSMGRQAWAAAHGPPRMGRRAPAADH